MKGVKNLIYIIFFLLVVSVSFCAQQFPTVWIRPPYYTKTEADERFVNVEGDIMQGNLDMNLFNITNVKYLSVQTISSTTVSGDLDVTNTFRVGGGFGSGGLTIYPDGTIMTNGDIVFSGDISTVNVTNYNITGNMTPSLDAEYTIGNATRRWKEIWFYDKIYDYNTTFFIDLNDPIQSLYAAGALYQRGGQLVIDVDNIVNYAVTSLNGFVGSVDILGNSPITVSSSNNQITIGLQYDSNTLDVGANGLYVIDKYVDITGDTMQGILNMGGYRIVNLGEPIDDSDATTKYYVDTLISGLEITYFFTNESSGVNTYYIMDPTRRVQATLVFGPFSTGTGQFVVGFITHNTTIPQILHKGVHLAHILAYKDGTKPVYIYWKLYERLSNGTEILIMTSETSVELTTERQPFDLPAVLDDDYILSDGSELVLKIFADVEQTGSDVYIYIDTGNESNSYFSVKVPSIEFKQIFVPYEGAVKNVSLGNYSLSASELTASKINVESGDTKYSFYISGSNLKLDYGTSNIFYYDPSYWGFTFSKKVTMKNTLDMNTNPIVNLKWMHIGSFTSPPCTGPGCLWVLQNPDDPAADFLVWAYKYKDHRHVFLTPAAENLNMNNYNITNVSNIQAENVSVSDLLCTDCVTLGEETTGTYVANISAGTGISVSGTPGEGWSPTISVVFGSTAGTAAEGNKQITVSAGSGLAGGGTVTIGAGGTITISHADTSSQGNVSNSGGTVIQSVSLDEFGHVTGLTSVDLDPRFVNVAGDTMQGNLNMNGYSITNVNTISNSGDINIMTTSGSNGDLIFSTNGTEVMRITESGNVGIGTTSPTDTLHVVGSIKADLGDTGDILLYDYNNNPTVFILSDTAGKAAQIFFRTQGPHYWTVGADDADGDKFKISDGIGLGSPVITIDPSTDYVGIGTTDPQAKLDVDGSAIIRGDLQVSGNDIKDSDDNTRIVLGEHTRIMPRYVYAGRTDNILGLAPIIMSNAFGFNPPYKVELYDPDAGTWSDITNDYTWEYITDLKGTEVGISVSANKDYMLRFYFDVGGWNYGDITAIVLKMRHLNYLKQVKVESSSYSDFSSDVATHLDWSGSIYHWDETTVWRLDSRTSGKRYVRITIKFSRSSDGSILIREIMGLSYANVASVLERWLPIDWDFNKNVFFSGNVGIGTTSPSAKLDVSGDIKASGVVYGNGEPYAKATFSLLEDYESSYHSYSYTGPNPIGCSSTWTIKKRFFPAGQLAKSTSGLFVYALQGYYTGVGGAIIVKLKTPDGTVYSREHTLSSTADTTYYGEISIPSSKLTNGPYYLQLVLCGGYDWVRGVGSTAYGRVLGAYLIVR